MYGSAYALTRKRKLRSKLVILGLRNEVSAVCARTTCCFFKQRGRCELLPRFVTDVRYTSSQPSLNIYNNEIERERERLVLLLLLLLLWPMLQQRVEIGGHDLRKLCEKEEEQT